MTDTPAAELPDATDEPPVPVAEVEAEDGEGDDLVQLVRTGWVRLRYTYADGVRQLRLRRPFFGELKALRLALESANDAISAAGDEAELLRVEIIDAAEAAANDPALSSVDRAKQRNELKRRNIVRARELNRVGEEQRLVWWRLVFDMLSPDGELPAEDELPSWLVDHRLPGVVLQHWRTVPLARG